MSRGITFIELVSQVLLVWDGQSRSSPDRSFELVSKIRGQ